jgi:hypothetical protein
LHQAKISASSSVAAGRRDSHAGLAIAALAAVLLAAGTDIGLQ